MRYRANERGRPNTISSTFACSSPLFSSQETAGSGSLPDGCSIFVLRNRLSGSFKFIKADNLHALVC